MAKKQIHRRNVFSADSNVEEDDFILADLDMMLDKEVPLPVSLNHFLDDEETIDRLLINSRFDTNYELEEIDREPDSRVIDDIDFADDSPDFGHFAIEPVNQVEQNRLSEVEKIPVSDFVSKADYYEIPDEDAIDRLLVDTGFDANHEPEESERASDEPVLDDLYPADDFLGFDHFVIGPVEQLEQNRFSEAEEISVSDLVSRADYDEIPYKEAIVVNDELMEEDAGATQPLVIDDISGVDKFRVNFKGQNDMMADKSIFDSEGSELAFDKALGNAFLAKEESHGTVKHKQAFSGTTVQEEALCSLNNEVSSSFGSRQELLNGYEDKIKKGAIITQVSLIFGVVALLSIVVMGVMVSSLQTKVSKLTDLVSIIEEDMSGLAEKNSGMGVNDSDVSIEQLNQTANGLEEHIAELDNRRATAPVPAKKKQSEAVPGKKVELQKHDTGQSQSLTEQPQNNTESMAAKQATSNKPVEARKSPSPVSDKKIPTETTLKTTTANKTTNNAKAASGWSVNLTAYKELSEAKRKAAKLIEKGFPVEVIAVNINNTKWYRLKVGGFKNKEKADSYATKLKKSLNLDAVFVDNF